MFKTLIRLVLYIVTFISAAGLTANPDVSFGFSSGAPAGMWLNSDVAKLSSANTLDAQPALVIDAMANPIRWLTCLKTPSGILQAGKSYIVTVDYRVTALNNDSAVLFLFRPINANDSSSDLGTNIVGELNADVTRKIRLRCEIPPGRNDYAFQIHVKNQARALIGSITVTENTMPFTVLAPTAQTKPAVLPPLPRGATEFHIDPPRATSGKILNAADYGVHPETPDNIPALNAALADCRKLNAAKLILPHGVYRFNSEPSVVFQDLSDFEFDGNGSTLVFLKNKNAMLEIVACQRVRLTNFNLDWDWAKDPLASVVKVEAVVLGKYADLRFVDYQQFPRTSTKTMLLDLLDPQTMSVACENGFAISTKGSKKEWLSGNLLRLFSTDKRLRTGQLYRLCHYNYDMGGVAMRDNVHLTLENINVYSCPGHAFLTNGDQHHWQLRNVNIIRPPNTTRPITCTADHHHIGQSKGFLKIENCEFSLGNDDCLNIHDCSAYGIRKSARTMTFNNLRDPPSYHIGDPVEFRNDDFSPAGFQSKISAIRRLSQDWELDFADPLPGADGASYIIFNRRYDSRNVIVRNNYFHDNRARGLLLLGRDITVENNRFFRNQHGAIKIETGYTLKSWCEGYGVNNVVIRNNIFDSVNPHYFFANEKYPAIYMSTYIKHDPSADKATYPILSDILVENNHFINNPGAIIYACSIKNLIVRNNRVRNDAAWQRILPCRGAIVADYASNVYVTGNTWETSPFPQRPGLTIDTETVKDAFCWDNHIDKR